ncbi:CsbD family protein [Tsukamurella asaccharolytica]|uniref:CsbD family protein n=1 Tax=Tsukamurella asaccharolytica TaxID=2592067 RepID=A0A5C5RBM0_9ACTN|nr:CsbD family protein [Tsukamurella asaccharolytica]TWS20507.1 CsbD family protein [Tsukamurella asaccharolytica]
MGLADDARNKAEELKGQAKEAAGAATGNDELKGEGKADQAQAEVKQKVSEVADKVKDGVNEIKDKLTGK